ncbi:MAG: DUF3108 domain-containing protein [Chlamydiae bacterium]|nr:DUF3108 domain-containing protein [Chlamydiota bacterium]MBI3267069.1 DUF3108 domain-containing protein [Chlamydiota bacterium]
MEIRFLISKIFIFFLFSFSLHAQEVSGTHGPRVGEKLTYLLRWGVIPVGWATLHVHGIQEYEGHRVYHIVMEAGSNSFLSTFYKVRDYAETYFDVEGLYSWRFCKKQSEGGYHSDEEMVYDQEKHTARYHSFKNGSVKEMEIPPKVQDTLSAIYFFRTFPMKVGESCFMDVNADEKNWKLEVQVEDYRKNWEVHRLGTFNAFYVEPLAQFKGMFEKRGRVWAWVSDDRRRLPLLVKTKVPFGSVTATLVKVEIIKNKGEE